MKYKTKEDWDSILEEFKDYKGTVKEFCKLKKISSSCLYKNKKVINTDNKIEPEISFTKIDLKEEKQNKENKLEKLDTDERQSSRLYTIKIKIGKARIILDSSDKNAISHIVKELSLIC